MFLSLTQCFGHCGLGACAEIAAKMCMCAQCLTRGEAGASVIQQRLVRLSAAWVNIAANLQMKLGGAAQQGSWLAPVKEVWPETSHSRLCSLRISMRMPIVGSPMVTVQSGRLQPGSTHDDPSALTLWIYEVVCSSLHAFPHHMFTARAGWQSSTQGRILTRCTRIATKNAATASNMKCTTDANASVRLLCRGLHITSSPTRTCATQTGN